MNTSKAVRRLLLESTRNTRDLGGYSYSGGATSWDQFFRSDCPNNLTEADARELSFRSISTIIDLRSDFEKEKNATPFISFDCFAVHNVALNDHMNATGFKGGLPSSVPELYINMLDNSQDAMRQVMNIFAGEQNGTLFHCTAGKDRTGVIAMLLLKLAGVSNEDVVADYSISEIYIKEQLKRQAAALMDVKIPDYFFESRPDSMRKTLEHLEEKYKTVEEYLLLCGVSDEDISAVKKRLVPKAEPTC